jgi:hypothetical protein
MADQESPMWPFLQNVGLMLTYKCQVSCPHCIVECSPNRTEEMRETDALDWIRQIAHYLSQRPHQGAVAHRWRAPV